jgi:hypothetical protein
MCGVGRPVHNVSRLRVSEKLVYVAEALFEVDDGFERRQQGFELLEVFGAIGAQLVEIDQLAGLEAFGELRHALG